MEVNPVRKICMVIPSMQHGGMERVMSELVGFFCKKEGLEVHLVLFGKEPVISYHVPENLIIHKPETIFNDIFRLYHTVRRLAYLRNSIIKINPYCILSFGEYWNSFVLLALIGLRYSVYISDRNSPNAHYGFFHSTLRKLLYPRAKGVIAQTEQARGVFLDQSLNSNIVVIGNPIHLIPPGNKVRRKIVLTIGRLIDSKNHDKLIELFTQIRKPGWQLIIIGGNALKQNNIDKLTRLVKTLDATSDVLLTGYQSDLDLFYQESGIFAFTSDSEGFPNVIGEAMSAGLPVVSFDCIAGPSEMLTDGVDGFLVPVNDYNYFKKRLEQLMDNESLRDKIGLEAKKSILKFSIDNIGAKYHQLLLGNEGPSD